MIVVIVRMYFFKYHYIMMIHKYVSEVLDFSY